MLEPDFESGADGCSDRAMWLPVAVPSAAVRAQPRDDSSPEDLTPLAGRFDR